MGGKSKRIDEERIEIMNIFFLDKTPEKSAQYLCDKHVPKMLLETAQMLSTAIQKYTGEIEELYKSTYPNHPMTKWVGLNKNNFQWAYDNGRSIFSEYVERFKPYHKSIDILRHIQNNKSLYTQNIPE